MANRKKHDLTGIATLSNNPLAMFNIRTERDTIGNKNGIYAIANNLDPVCPNDKVVTLDDVVEFLEEISHSTVK